MNLTISENPAPLAAEPGVPGAVPHVSSITASPASPGAIVGYNVYRSRTQPVQITQSNLVATSPAWFRYSELAHFDGLNWPT